jgi:hypothetical protein
VAAASSWLRATYGCTPREAALAHTLAQGRTLAEAAGALGISVHTARTQLSAPYRHDLEPKAMAALTQSDFFGGGQTRRPPPSSVREMPVT